MCGWMKKNRKSLFLLMVLVVIGIDVYADGKAGIEKAESEVKGYFSGGEKLMYAIGALVGLIGAVKVYSKWNSGDPDTSKVAAAWFGSCIFLVVVATIIKSFFGV